MAAWSNPDTRETVELLIEQGPLLEAIEAGGETPDETAEKLEQQQKGDQTQIQRAARCVHEHAEVIDALRDGPTRKRELVEKTDYLEPAINDALSDLSEHDFLRDWDGEDIELNAYARLMFDTYAQVCKRVAQLPKPPDNSGERCE